MKKKDVTLGDVHELVIDFMSFTKDQFDRQSIQFEKLNLDLGYLRQEQREMGKEIKALREDMDGVTGATAELAEKIGVVEE